MNEKAPRHKDEGIWWYPKIAMRNRVFEIISVGDSAGIAGKAYDIVMLVAIAASMIPLCFKGTNAVFDAIDIFCTILFLLDYAARLITADLYLGKGAKSFIRYPFTPMAILDLLSILPGLVEISPTLRVLRLARLLKLLRIFKFIRYSQNLNVLKEVIEKNKQLLICVFAVAGIYVFISAIVVFNIEPDTFDTFFDAIYWACVSLSTVGYGDVYCTSVIGKTFTIFSSLIGIAIIALPAGIITGGFVEEFKNRKPNV